MGLAALVSSARRSQGPKIRTHNTRPCALEHYIDKLKRSYKITHTNCTDSKILALFLRLNPKP